ncbi:hypothetical protein DFH05DRAFT_1476422 [Lentinula detonsa]|uniref:Uncharacterized protein n=1 Tax=Lentinula detonsa TaxID=2804962 RepID=A0A9W8P907_9AGAR|nr:hypothetical protein DFH05DRAFT_1476422 [Lentinula detonsa]
MRTIPTPVHFRCVLPLFLQLVLFFVAPTTVAAVPLSPSPTISSDVIAVSGTTTSASYTSTDASLPTSSTKTKEITVAVAFTSEKITYPWQSDAKSAVRKLLNLALEACSETGHSEGSGGKPKNKLDISWGKLYAAAPPEFTFKVQVQNWPGRTGPKWLWGLKSSEFSGTLRLVPSVRCPGCHLTKKRFNIVFGILNDESNTRLVTVMNDEVTLLNGSENDDVPLISLPPPAFVKAGKYSGAETGESSNTESLGKGREKGLTSSRPAAVTRKKGDLETVKESDESDVKGKGKATE